MFQFRTPKIDHPKLKSFDNSQTLFTLIENCTELSQTKLISTQIDTYESMEGWRTETAQRLRNRLCDKSFELFAKEFGTR